MYRNPTDVVSIQGSSRGVELRGWAIGSGDPITLVRASPDGYGGLKVYDSGGANPEIAWNNGNLPVASGSWAPSIVFTGGVTSITYGSRVGRWFRVGNLVFAHIALSTTAVVGASGDVHISAPPLAGMSAGAQLLTIRTTNIPIGSGNVPYAYVRAGETAISIAMMRSNNTATTIKADDWGSNGSALITGVYLTDNP